MTPRLDHPDRLARRAAAAWRRRAASNGWHGRLAHRVISPAAAMLLALSFTLSAAAQEVRLYPTALITEDVVRLRDVALLSGLDAPDLAEVAYSVLRDAPHPASSVVVDAADVRRALAGAGINLAHVRLCGASRCEVRRLVSPLRAAPAAPTPAAAASAADSAPTNPVAPAVAPTPTGPTPPEPEPTRIRVDAPAAPPGSLEFFVRDYLAALAPDGGRLDIRFSPACRNALALAGPDLRFAVRERPSQWLGMVALEIDVLEPGRPPRRVPISAEVSLTRPVVVARRDINRGRRITPGDVAVEDRTFTRCDQIGLTDPADAVGREARGLVRVGEQLSSRDLRVAPLVRRGELVTVWSRRGALVVKTVGRAAADGALGDVIAIRGEPGREPFDATVTGPRTVSVVSTPLQVASR